MARTLHIVRRPDDSLAGEVAAAGQAAGDTVVLIADGVLCDPGMLRTARVFAAAHDIAARGIERPFPSVDIDQIARWVVEHDRVVVW